MKNTKIVATIGPASEKQPIMEKMIRSGMNVARLNFSHGTYKHHAMLIRNLRAAAKRQGVYLGILADLQGPRIRLGALPDEGIAMNTRGHVVLSTEPKPRKGTIPVTYANLHKDVKPGDRILIADGTMEVVVEHVKGREITARVEIGGTLKSHKGLNIPTATLHIPPLTKKDLADVEFALSQGVDMVALSFVMTAENVKQLRRKIQNVAKGLKRPELAATPIIVKIEKHEAVKNFDAILAVADGVMIARGDLALEIDQAKVPTLQKQFIDTCRAHGKPVIVATQMLESMIQNPRPTRAEISDVGHAVIDHTDATMLSGESAMGKYVVETISTMTSIISETEQSKWDDVVMRPDQLQGSAQRSWFGAVATLLAHESKPRCLVVATASGRTAQYVASFRPGVPLVAAVPSARVAQRLALVWGITAIVVPEVHASGDFQSKMIKQLFAHKLVKKGDTIVEIVSDPIGLTQVPNVISLRKV